MPVVDPVFWLGVSVLLVAVSIAAVLVVMIPALQELARAARSAEKLFDTLSRELPPTLESIRLTGLEISDLTDEVSEGVQSAKRVVQQVDQGLGTARKQVQRAQTTGRGFMVGFKAAWKTFRRSPSPPPSRRSVDRLPASTQSSLDPVFLDSYSDPYTDEHQENGNRRDLGDRLPENDPESDRSSLPAERSGDQNL